MIRLQHLSYAYPGTSAPVLRDVTLDIPAGAFALLAGPSGAGKSTLLRCLNGLVPHFSGGTLEGQIQVLGHDPVREGPQALSRVVGFVFQDPEAQFVLDRVEDEVAFALENLAVPTHQMRARVTEALDLLGLLPLRDRPLESLSGGEKQRVAIAAALALYPRALALDEPTSQLDPQSAEEVLQALVRLNRELGLTVILAEHRLERVLPYATQMIYLPAPAAPPQSGPPRQLLQHVPDVPPVVALGRALGWEPLPLSIADCRLQIANRESQIAYRESQHSMRDQRSAISDQRSAICDQRLVINGVCFRYSSTPALRNVTLSVAPGELVALMGRNGSGKTTLLKCIVGLLRPQEGTIALDGEPLVGRETADICRRVGYLPQLPDDLLFADTVAEELAVTLRNHGLLGRPPIDPAALLERLGLAGLASAYPRDLSVGQRQRVALGAVTVTAPRLLLLDEPTRGMDYAAKAGLLRLLRTWQAEGAGVLLVTHDVELAAQAADRVVLLDEGRVCADGAPAEVLTASPQFAPPVSQLFPGCGWLTVEEALRGLQSGG